MAQRTPVNVPAEIRYILKVEAAKRRTTMQALVQRALQEFLARAAKDEGHAKRRT